MAEGVSEAILKLVRLQAHGSTPSCFQYRDALFDDKRRSQSYFCA